VFINLTKTRVSRAGGPPKYAVSITTKSIMVQYILTTPDACQSRSIDVRRVASFFGQEVFDIDNRKERLPMPVSHNVNSSNTLITSGASVRWVKVAFSRQITWIIGEQLEACTGVRPNAKQLENPLSSRPETIAEICYELKI
jgi:hypothetical protein